MNPSNCKNVNYNAKVYISFQLKYNIKEKKITRILLFVTLIFVKR